LNPRKRKERTGDVHTPKIKNPSQAQKMKISHKIKAGKTGPKIHIILKNFLEQQKT